ncbi:dihydrodipicolinate synthase family protein [[Curtobacterium] plantarum]|uniref:dihydrodipicolinate synthase family protein n=1 Tax=[Curtobacterium] plantarum TaxID=221276 RepID=UPI000F0781DA|nr:dihydrodipicolinate synthase family protein [[Curtobacterium] plantarum]RNA72324.1 dihydrodipicolinate synthase family protein [[Curtobacterium] plantarum]
MFTGLSAFPLTPFSDGKPDEKGFLRLLRRLTDARVDSVCALGSTGSYAYMTREQRRRIAELTTANAGDIPVMICIGAVSTEEVLRLADDAQQAGARGLLLPPVSYQALREEEVFGLFETVSRNVSVPVCVYDNPGTTHFQFTDELHRKIAALPAVASVKIPGVPVDEIEAMDRVRQLRNGLQDGVTVGISGDVFAANGLIAGCEVWYSVFGGLFPRMAKAMTDAAVAGDFDSIRVQNSYLEPFWALYRKHGGSFRVAAAVAGIMGLTDADCLPRPLLPLSEGDRSEVARVLSTLDLE